MFAEVLFNAAIAAIIGGTASFLIALCMKKDSDKRPTKTLWQRLKSYFHRHDWRGMEWDEWMQNGGFGTPDFVCTKCCERRWWSDI